MKTHPKEVPIVILSGGTGRTAEQVVKAALAQFDAPPVKLIRHPKVRRVRDAERIVRKAAADGAVVCHTFVAPRIREAVTHQLLELEVPAVDALGPTLTLLADHLGCAPRGRAGLLYELCKEQFDRSDAVDFTLAHDDGQRLHDLDQADVVLVGASRVSKSVTCFYLAARGIRAANVPLTSVHAVPPELASLDPDRVIGLTMNASRLAAIRQTRLERITARGVAGYADPRDVGQELCHVRDLMARHGWQCLDVSYRATEEVASEIVTRLSALDERNSRRSKRRSRGKAG